jgi:hypothetical protein
VTLVALDVALSAADAALATRFVSDAYAQIVDSRLAEDLYTRLIAQTLDSPQLERVIGEALNSPQAERLVGRVIDSHVLDVTIDHILASDGLWHLVDEVARSPSVTAAISHQGVGFANQIAGVARDRSRTADDRLERLAARVARRRPRHESPPSEPAPGS